MTTILLSDKERRIQIALGSIRPIRCYDCKIIWDVSETSQVTLDPAYYIDRTNSELVMFFMCPKCNKRLG